MIRIVTICLRAALSVFVLCAGWPVAISYGFDAELLKARLIPRQGDAGNQDFRSGVDGPLWLSSRDRDEADRHRAMKVSKSYIDDNLKDWVKDGPLERVERFRHTGVTLDSASASPAYGHKVDMSLRVSEKLRLRVSAAEFQRDLWYDPVDARMWVDLLQMQLPKSESGLKLTNTYRLDNDSTNLILKFNRPLK